METITETITDREKLEMVNKACELLSEAREKFKEAARLLHLCGTDLCDSLVSNKVESYNTYGCNVQIYKGIEALAEIIGKQIHFPIDDDTAVPDWSPCKLDYHNIVFLQCVDESDAYSDNGR